MLDFIAPSFIVVDLEVSVKYYIEKLGFFVRFIGPSEAEGGPFWAIVGRDEISIFLKAIASDVLPIPNHTRHEWAPWDAYVSAEKPDELFAEFGERGATFHKPLIEEGGLRGFEVRDADGYVLYFGRPWP
jgi:hypothetical protein